VAFHPQPDHLQVRHSFLILRAIFDRVPTEQFSAQLELALT
jgi:hypothetical protein